MSHILSVVGGTITTYHKREYVCETLGSLLLSGWCTTYDEPQLPTSTPGKERYMLKVRVGWR